MFLDPMDNPLLFMLLVISGIVLIVYSLSRKKINKVILGIGIALLLFCAVMHFAKTEMRMNSFKELTDVF